MKKLGTSFIATSTAQPIKKGSLEHLQSAYQECLESIVRGNIGPNYDATKMYIVWGCANTGTGLNYIISAGAVFFNGEIYQVDATTFTASSGQVAVGTITTTQFTAAYADPVIFTDGSSHNVHDIRKIVFASGASGSADVDYTDVGSAWKSASGASQASVISGPGGMSIDACVVETYENIGYRIKRFKITITMSSGAFVVGFALPGMISDTFSQAIACPISGTATDTGTGTVSGNTLRITSSTGSFGAGTYDICGQILYKIN